MEGAAPSAACSRRAAYLEQKHASSVAERRDVDQRFDPNIGESRFAQHAWQASADVQVVTVLGGESDHEVVESIPGGQ